MACNIFVLFLQHIKGLLQPSGISYFFKKLIIGIVYFSYKRKWEDNLVTDVCNLLKDDLPLDPGAPGGMVEFRRTLTTSFFFKFYLSVQIQLQQKVFYLSC